MFVDLSLIASPEESVFRKGGLVRLVVVEIALRNAGPSNAHFPYTPLLDLVSITIEDAKLYPLGRTHRSGIVFPRREWVGAHEVRRFGHGVRLEHRSFEGLLQFVEQSGCQL